MSWYKIHSDTLTSIADSIRAKTGSTDKITVADMPAQIESITGGGSSENVRYVTFMSEDGTTELYKKAVFVGDDCMDVVEKGLLETPTKESTNTEVFTHSGWSLSAGGTADDSALLNVTEDRTVYAAYKTNTRYYTVRFFDGETLLHTVYAEYGSTVDYTPAKDGYQFDGWQPSNENITQDTDCYAAWIKLTTYGVEWDYSNSTSVLTRTGAAEGFSDPVPATSFDTVGSSPFDNIMPWAGIKRYNIIDGAIAYSEDDEGFSMTDYDTVVYIPPFYYAAHKDETNTKWSWSISSAAKEGYALHPGSGRYIGRYHTSGDSTAVFSKPGVKPLVSTTRPNFRTYSHNKGDNWWMIDIATWSALQMLFIVEFADFNSQSKLGYGYGFESQALGSTDAAVYHTYKGLQTNQYRWIEQPFGRCCDLVDGFMASGRVCYLGTDNSTFADSTSGLTAAGVTLPSSGYITGLGYSEKFPWAFLPNTATGGGSTTYIPDYVNSSAFTCVLYVGCSYNSGDSFGLFYYNATDTSGSLPGVGSRLVYIP